MLLRLVDSVALLYLSTCAVLHWWGFWTPDRAAPVAHALAAFALCVWALCDRQFEIAPPARRELGWKAAFYFFLTASYGALAALYAAGGRVSATLEVLAR